MGHLLITASLIASRNLRKLLVLHICLFISLGSFCQKAYFIDGYHGGVWGHYPDGFTRYIVDQLKANPDWKINIELEPETWDRAMIIDPMAYHEFHEIFADQSATGRIEYVNPAYAQSYMYNISGESVIRQFAYGIRKVKAHFPEAILSTYSVEEPCFTSALPQILKSFGFRYASLKNPNTCWGGYTRAFGGELINWVGPDGTKLPTVPRYGIERLDPKSTWQTIASLNSPEYVNAAFNDGIQHPTGMCFQDAGWKIGPWLGDGKHTYHPYVYTTWRGYFENIAVKKPQKEWMFSQEDVLVSLVWGAQVLQRLAQQVRFAENKIIRAEKMAALAHVYGKEIWPNAALDNAWRTLLLAQHHDCWIVPYNGGRSNSWADKVAVWTSNTNAKSDSIIFRMANLLNKGKPGEICCFRVFNTLGIKRSGYVTVDLPKQLEGKKFSILGSDKKEIPFQMISDGDIKKIILKASVPSFGYATLMLKMKEHENTKGANACMQADSSFVLESDFYRIVVDPSKGGTMRSIVAKKLDDKEFVDKKDQRSFNEIRGFFYNDGRFYSSTDRPAKCRIIENGPLRVRLSVEGSIADHSFKQIITLAQGERRIDINLTINWKENVGIGEYSQAQNYQAEDYKKAFYNDKYKLLALFPLNLKHQKVFKDAPFDVTESKLSNTFFNTWDSIKNNVILNWVDIEDISGEYGCALFSDHTTSYTHGEDFPLGLTLAYSGKGLWGMDYKISEPTEVNYALVPHKWRWDNGGITKEAELRNEPLFASAWLTSSKNDKVTKSMIETDDAGIEISSVTSGGEDLQIRVFNAAAGSGVHKIFLGFKPVKVNIVDLSGNIIEQLPVLSSENNKSSISFEIPRFGIRTIQFFNEGIFK